MNPARFEHSFRFALWIIRDFRWNVIESNHGSEMVFGHKHFMIKFKLSFAWIVKVQTCLKASSFRNSTNFGHQLYAVH